jgi:uncharacterized protein YgiM (DUF1202 family)
MGGWGLSLSTERNSLHMDSQVDKVDFHYCIAQRQINLRTASTLHYMVIHTVTARDAFTLLAGGRYRQS